MGPTLSSFYWYWFKHRIRWSFIIMASLKCPLHLTHALVLPVDTVTPPLQPWHRYLTSQCTVSLPGIWLTLALPHDVSYVYFTVLILASDYVMSPQQQDGLRHQIQLNLRLNDRILGSALCEKPLKKWHLEFASLWGDYSTFLCLSL